MENSWKVEKTIEKLENKNHINNGIIIREGVRNILWNHYIELNSSNNKLMDFLLVKIFLSKRFTLYFYFIDNHFQCQGFWFEVFEGVLADFIILILGWLFSLITMQPLIWNILE